MNEKTLIVNNISSVTREVHIRLEFNSFPKLESEQLILEPLSYQHIPKLFDYFSNKENFIYAEINIHESIKKTQAYVDKMNTGVNNNQWIVWAICLKDTQEIIGTISIWNFDFKKGQDELGYGLHPNDRGHGYMLEALKKVIYYAFTEIKLKTLQAYTSPKNNPSVRLLEKLSFDYINTVEDDYSNSKLMSIYQINRSNWVDSK